VQLFPNAPALTKDDQFMYRDVAQWSGIRDRVLRKGVSIRQVVRETGISRKTVRKMLDHPLPQPYRPRSRRYPKLGPHTSSVQRMLLENATLPPSARLSIKAIYERIRETESFRGSYGSVSDYARSIRPDDVCIWEYAYDLLTSLEKKRAIDFLFLLSRADPPVISRSRTEQFFRDAGRVINIAPKPDKRELARQAAFEWMRAVLQKEISPDALRQEIGDIPDIAALVDRLYGGRLSDRNRSMVVIASHRGLSSGTVRDFLAIDKKTHRKYLRTFKNGGCDTLFARPTRSTRKFDNEATKQAVFALLHEPPSNYGVNRTTWIMPDLSRVLRDMGQPACPEVIRKITKAAGYRWRRARKVLTSTDPEYREKVHHIQSILAELQENEAFFSIDEFGPFAIRAQGGKALVAPGEMPTVPQHQKSKGSLIMTTALELSHNQITYFYSPRKDTGEMLRMLAKLIQEYGHKGRIYLSWDAASWHMSKMLYARVAEHNDAVARGDIAAPLVALAPLPAGAQFLNVIESVFSGMARAVIANSNYPSVEEARAAIERYIQERNQKFRYAPKRAGGKIWGMEREPAVFSGSNNCKDPRYYR
jgi:transposase